MKKIATLLVLLASLADHGAMAQNVISLCTQIPGSPNTSCQPVSKTSPMPMVAIGSAGATSGYVYTSNGPGLAATFKNNTINLATQVTGALSVASGGTGQTVSANILANVYNFAPASTFSKWRLALAKVKDGTANARILFVGDSTFMGVGSTLGGTYPNVGSVPARIAQLFNTDTLTPAIDSLAVAPSNTDSRWNVTAGNWVLDGGGLNLGPGNKAFYFSSTNGSTVVFTPNPQVNCDGFYLYYLSFNGGGTITATATGGTPVPINTNSGGASNTVRVLVSALAASSTNTISIVSTSGTNYLYAVEPVLSTKSQILVGNAGVGGSTTTNWNAGSAGQTSANFIQAVAPDLTVISLGINDAGASTLASTVSTNLQVLITAAQASGDVLLVDMPPSQGSPYTAYEPLYLPTYLALASANNLTYLSTFNRFNSTWLSTFMYDALHPTNKGYWDWAQFIFNTISAP